MKLSTSIVRAFAPSGVLRASINTGNPILAASDGDASAKGVSVDLARGFAERLGVPLQLVVFATAGKSVDAVTQEQADIGFFAIDPKRGEGVRFTSAYVLIEGCYVVRNDSPLTSLDQADVPGQRIVVGKGSAYDLFLTRELKKAAIVRAPSSPAVVEHFLAEQADVAAGVKQQLEADAARLGDLRLLPGRFMVIQQAMGCPRTRGEEAAQVLTQYVEDMKASGFVADALQRHGIAGATVAPAARRWKADGRLLSRPASSPCSSPSLSRHRAGAVDKSRRAATSPPAAVTARGHPVRRSAWTVLLDELPESPQTNRVGNGRRHGVRKREHLE